MKPRINPLISSVLATLLLCVTSIQVSMAEETAYHWKMQRYSGEEFTPLFKKFTDKVAQKTNNRLIIKVFKGGELISNPEMLRATSKGLIQMAFGYPNYWAGEFPLSKIESGLPLAWTSAEEVDKLWNEYGFQQLLEEEYQKKGVVYLTKVMGGSYDLLTRKPVTSIADMQKIKIRTATSMAELLHKFDIATVFLPVEELYTALSTNIIDGVIYSSDYEYDQLKLYESAKDYTVLGLGYPGFIDNILVNEKAWKTLPEDLQTILRAEVESLARDYHNEQVRGAKETKAKNIFNYHELNKEDVGRFTEKAKELWQDEAKRSPANQKAIDAIIQLGKDSGRLK